MARTDLKLKAKDQSTGNTTTTSITHVNENATSSTLLQFSQMLNNLTTNTYDSTDRVQTINVDTEEVPITLPEYDWDSLLPETIRIDKSEITPGTPMTITLKKSVAAAIAAATGVYVTGSEKMTFYFNATTLYFLTSSNYTPTASTGNAIFNFSGRENMYRASKKTIQYEIY